MTYTIESLIKTERERLKFDAADFLVSLEKRERQIERKISAREILVSGILGASVGYGMGKNIFGEEMALIYSVALSGINMYCDYKLQKSDY